MFKKIGLLCLALLVVASVACKSASKKPSKKPASKPSTTLGKPTDSPGSKKAAEGLVYEKSELLSPVLEKAQQQKKPVFLFFTASWCAPCKVMKTEVFSQKPTFSYLNSHFLNFEVNMDLQSGKNIAGLYSVTALPTLIFVNPQGVELERHQGMATHSIITSMGDAALAKINK